MHGSSARRHVARWRRNAGAIPGCTTKRWMLSLDLRPAASGETARHVEPGAGSTAAAVVLHRGRVVPAPGVVHRVRVGSTAPCRVRNARRSRTPPSRQPAIVPHTSNTSAALGSLRPAKSSLHGRFEAEDED
jgi:hypothetical protein